MKHCKIGALKIAFLQFFLLKINLKIKSTLKLGKKKIISDDFKLNIFENGM